MTPVELGAYFQDHVRVLDGLKAGEPIIVSGTQKVFAGWAVKAIDTNLGTSGEANHELN